jgi:hypothetical protein
MEREADPKMYTNVVDNRTGLKLFSKETSNQVKNLRRHIINNCLSDPEGISFYYSTGRKDKDDVPVYHCVRGTSSLEAYHKGLHMMMANYSHVSPKLAHYLLQLHNFR